MGVPDQTPPHPATCTAGDAGSFQAHCKTVKSGRGKASPCWPRSGDGQTVPCPCLPVTWFDPTVGKTTTLGGQEKTEYDSGATVEMWFMCRLFSPRRRHGPRSSSDSDGQQPQPQQSQEKAGQQSLKSEGSICAFTPKSEEKATGHTPKSEKGGGHTHKSKEKDNTNARKSEDRGEEHTRKSVEKGGDHAGKLEDKIDVHSLKLKEKDSRHCDKSEQEGGGHTHKPEKGKGLTYKVGGVHTGRHQRAAVGLPTADYTHRGQKTMDGEEEDDAQMDAGKTDAVGLADSGGGDQDGDQEVNDEDYDSGLTVGSHHREHTDLARNFSLEDADGDEGLKEQLAMVQAMVQEMKVGFMAAMDQLSTMQDGDQSSLHKMDATCQRQDQQLSDLSHSIDSLRTEVSSLSQSVSEVLSVQQSLQDRLLAIQTGQQQLVEELVTAGVLSEQSREAVTKHFLAVGSLSLEASNSKPAHGADGASSQGSKRQENKTAVTATACKSLSLTQALAARCQDIDASDSSEEDVNSSCGHGQGGDDGHSMSTAGPALSHSAVAESPQRRQAVQEIVDSEQEYCTQLWTVVNVYQLPLQDGHYMSSRQLAILFPSPLADLYEQHSQMLQSLQDRLVHWSYAGVVGDVFARMTDSNSNLLGLYQEYVESLPASISCLRRQMAQSRSFRLFAKEQRECSTKNDLLSLLICPLQRIPKYMLQLQHVLQHTSEDHPDHFNLQASLSKLQDFVERFNHDITHTTQAIALDLQHLQAQGTSFRSSASGSSCEVLPPSTSTIDSGIHSTGEDSFPPRLLRNGHDQYDGYLPQWLEDNNGYQHGDPRHVMSAQRRGQAQSRLRGQGLQSRLASHSQPNLAHGGYIVPSQADPQASVPQIRSYGRMAASAVAEGSARQRRYKIKKQIEGQGGHSPLRPASAMDFGEPEEREGVVGRPHSVLGPFPGDTRARVIQVYSRKPPRPVRHVDPAPTPAQPSSHHAVRASHPHIILNGHWDPAAGGDPSGQYASLVDYDDEEDDTRALSDAHSSSSQKASSGRSQAGLETETDNSEDYSQEDLAAALSHHLTAGGGGDTITSHDLQMYRQVKPHSTPLHHHLHHISHLDHDQHVDVQLDSPSSDYMQSRQSQKPPEDMSEELKLDLTCFQEDENKPSLLKRSQPPEPPVESAVPLSMNPKAGNMNNSAEAVPYAPDRSLTEPPKEVMDSLTGDKTDKFTSLPPIHPQEAFPAVADTNGRTFHTELERPPVRRSVTPSEFSNISRPTVLRRAATPSEFLGAADSVGSKGGRRRKDSKNTSSENLHRSIDDVSLSTSKKKPFRTSLKNLFQRKKGSVMLDELEREYTKELVRQCLLNNGHTNISTTTTATINNNINNNCSGQASTPNEEEGNDRKTIVSLNNLNNNHNNHHHQQQQPQGRGLWGKVCKSPLFFLSHAADTAATDTSV